MVERRGLNILTIMSEDDVSPSHHRTYRGVTNRGGKFEARINHLGKRQSLGYFATAEEAARAYDVKAHDLQKPLNFPWDDAVKQAGDKNME